MPGMYAVQRVGDRWLVVSVNEWSLAAGRTFERREMRAADVALAPPCPRPEKPAQRSNSELMVSRALREINCRKRQRISEPVRDAAESRMLPVLDLEPVWRPAR